ncbi:hypothetical protein [Streptomyces flaveolus]|uniref:hypothetical protein n=1 Tax=Streptomyces flaveolus TaxID=67297 RepID=UPI00370076E9
MSNHDSIVRGYAQTGRTGASATPGAHANVSDNHNPETYDRIIQGRAHAYTPDPGLDQLLARIAKDPSYEDSLSPTQRMTLAYYEDAKAAHDDLNA